MQCTNHLKQLGLGVHNFHDTRGGLPPAVICPYRMSIFPILFPYIEQQQLYNIIASTVDDFDNGTLTKAVTADRWWGKDFSDANPGKGLTDGERLAFGSVPFFYCPTRRRPPAYLGNESPSAAAQSGSGEQIAMYWQGPQIDYAFVVTAAAYDNLTDSVWYQWATHDADRGIARQRGPFRQSLSDYPNDPVKNWEPRDTFAWLADGTSNQLMLGEKYFNFNDVGDSKLGICDWIGDDCTYLSAGQNGASVTSAARTFDFGSVGTIGIALPVHTWNAAHHFGATHAEVCNFLIGDGSVRGISATTSQEILYALGCINDGVTVALPQ